MFFWPQVKFVKAQNKPRNAFHGIVVEESF
jgi:hypothetical protein